MSYCINKEDSSWSKQIHNQRSGFSSTKLRSLLQKHQPENVHVFNHYKKHVHVHGQRESQRCPEE